MAAQFFTVEQVNELLPTLEPLVGQLLGRRARVMATRSELGEALDDLTNNVGSRRHSEMVREFMIIEQLVDRIQAYGCILKDMNSGLLDFLAQRNGREVYLCWRYGEPRVAFYHELHTGFNGRQPV